MKLSKEQWEGLEREFLDKARSAFGSLFEEGEQEQLITLTQREERVLQKGAELESWLLEQHLALDPLADPKAAEALRCPRCRGLGVREERHPEAVPRRLHTRAGKQEFRRRKYRCPSCRTVFFPLGPAAAVGSGRL